MSHQYFLSIFEKYSYVFTVPLIMYLPTIYCLSKLNLKKTDKYDTLYAIWNFCLFGFSLWGAVSGCPLIAYKIINEGFVKFVTDDDLITPIMLQIAAFTFSKVPELFDSLFIILRGRNLIFLHYYHHIVTLIYTWQTFKYIHVIGNMSVFHGFMNYFVHTIVYLWYAVSALKYRTPSFVKSAITVIQTLQMVLGVLSFVISIYHRSWYVELPYIAVATITMYMSYVFLFGKLTYDKVFKVKSTRNENKTGKDENKPMDQDKW